jgi:uncharacterized membrane protein YtjA (UPF0391 family)
MLYWAVVFFVIALVAALLGFTGIAAAAAGIAKFLFFLFLVMFLIFLIKDRALSYAPILGISAVGIPPLWNATPVFPAMVNAASEIQADAASIGDGVLPSLLTWCVARR